MSHQRMYGDPRSGPPDRQRRDDPWERRGREPEGFKGGHEDAGYQGGGTRRYEAGGYGAPPDAGHYPDRGDSQMSDFPDADRANRFDRRSPGSAPSSTYGGLGEGHTYGTHGWTRGGGGYDMDDRQFDPDYRQWREQQMREFDRDYEQWRQERYKKFSEEFDQWRAARRTGGATEASQGSSSPGGSSATSSPKTG
jgi:hypothetical protein